jgi:hypothetical protein
VWYCVRFWYPRVGAHRRATGRAVGGCVCVCGGGGGVYEVDGRYFGVFHAQRILMQECVVHRHLTLQTNAQRGFGEDCPVQSRCDAGSNGKRLLRWRDDRTRRHRPSLRLLRRTVTDHIAHELRVRAGGAGGGGASAEARLAAIAERRSGVMSVLKREGRSYTNICG